MRRDSLTDSQINTWKTKPVDIAFSYGKTTKVFKNFYFMQATAIYADHATDTSDNTLFFVEFADARIHFLMNAIDETLSSYATWDDLLNYLWGKLPTSAGAYPGIPTPSDDWDEWDAGADYSVGDPVWNGDAAYFCVNDHTAADWNTAQWAKVISDNITAAETFTVNGQNLWDAIIGILEMLGLGVVYNPISGLFEIFYGFVSQSRKPDNCVCTLSTNPKESTVFFPEKFRVYFLPGQIRWQTWAGTIQTVGPAVGADRQFDVASNIPNAKAGTLAQLCYPIAASGSALTLQNVANDLVARHTARVQLMANCEYRQYVGIVT
jgi:hypothetical protein